MAGKKRTVTQTELIEDDDLEAGGEEGEGGERQKRTQPIDVKGLPEGVRAVLRLKPWRDVSEYSAYIYRKEPDPTKPGRIAKKFKDRVYNTEIEESWLQARYPQGGRFSVIYQVPHPSRPGDVQIHADDFEIDPSNVPHALAAPGVSAAPSGVSAPGGDLISGIANLRALVEVVVMLKGDAPAAVSPPAWYEKMYQDKIKSLDEMEGKLLRKIAAPAVTVHESEPKDELSAWPDFLRPFAPQIKAFGIQTMETLGSKLLGKGLESAGLRFLVLRNPKFREIWADPEKRQHAAAGIIQSLGEAGEALVRLFAEEMEKGGAE